MNNSSRVGQLRSVVANDRVRWRHFGATLMLFALAGCAATKPAAENPAYFGPTDPPADVIAKINANARRLPTLWSPLYFELTVPDDKKNPQFVNGNGVLLYRRPGDFRLVGSKEISDIFELGSNSTRFWLKVIPQKTQWFGDFANLGKPCAQTMPIRPDLVREVFGLTPIVDDALAQPAPVMRFNNNARAYMFVWSVVQNGRWVPQKEIWYDMTTFEPQEVVLFDADGMGRVVLTAKLSQPVAVSVKGVPKLQWPTIAGQYDLFFPELPATMKLTLDAEQVASSHRGAPSDASFQFRLDPDMKAIQIDADCGK